jgi:hypothetical protein
MSHGNVVAPRLQPRLTVMKPGCFFHRDPDTRIPLFIERHLVVLVITVVVPRESLRLS